MCFNCYLSHIHWLPVIVMTILSFALGAAWHQPFLFGKLWMKENRYGEDGKKPNYPLIFGGTGVLHFVLLAALSAIVSGYSSASEGLATGFWMSILFVLPPMGATYLFANRSLKLLAVDAGLYVVLMSLSGLIFSIW